MYKKQKKNYKQDKIGSNQKILEREKFSLELGKHTTIILILDADNLYLFKSAYYTTNQQKSNILEDRYAVSTNINALPQTGQAKIILYPLAHPHLILLCSTKD